MVFVLVSGPKGEHTVQGEARTREEQNKTCLGPCLLVWGSSPVRW